MATENIAAYYGINPKMKFWSFRKRDYLRIFRGFGVFKSFGTRRVFDLLVFRSIARFKIVADGPAFFLGLFFWLFGGAA